MTRSTSARVIRPPPTCTGQRGYIDSIVGDQSPHHRRQDQAFDNRSGFRRWCEGRSRGGPQPPLRQAPQPHRHRRCEARTWPTSTTSPSFAKISVSVPAMGGRNFGVDLVGRHLKEISSIATVSPTFLNQRVIVPSVTGLAQLGLVTSAMSSRFLLQPCSERPVSDMTVSPNISLMVGWG